MSMWKKAMDYLGLGPDDAYDDYDDRDHRKSGWSLFGRGKRQPQPQQSNYAPQMRPTSSAQPAPEPEAQDDLEIPSFLRRLAN